jgi:hypothetical protein
MLKVFITVEGGCVQNVDCPPGVEVTIRDYDTDGEEPDPERGLIEDDNGDLCSEWTVGGEPLPPMAGWYASSYLPHGSADGTPAVYSESHEQPLAIAFDPDSGESAAHIQLMAEAPRLADELRKLRDWIPQWMEGPEVDSVCQDIDSVLRYATSR